MAEETLHELAPPPDAREKGGHEVLRCFVVDGGLSIALRRSFDEPGTWGVLLADLARHLAGRARGQLRTAVLERPGGAAQVAGKERRGWAAHADRKPLMELILRARTLALP